MFPRCPATRTQLYYIPKLIGYGVSGAGAGRCPRFCPGNVVPAWSRRGPGVALSRLVLAIADWPGVVPAVSRRYPDTRAQLSTQADPVGRVCSPGCGLVVSHVNASWLVSLL
jgi:hypothetical protein